MTLSPGDRIDRFRLVAPLGEGGQGSVWRAEDLVSSSTCALKLVPLERTSPPDLERVRREARALARLSHPALVACRSFFEDHEHGFAGILVDLVEGTSLDEEFGGSRLRPDLSVAIVRQLAIVLAYIHAAGIVHRDVKPQNVMLSAAFWENPDELGAVKLIDFGIASGGDAAALTRTGFFIGTPAFMAPELLEPSHWGGSGATPSSDVFSLGVLAWLAISGEHPTGLKTGATPGDYSGRYRTAEGNAAAWPLSTDGSTTPSVIPKCLSLRPAGRPTAAEIVAALARQDPVTTALHQVPAPGRSSGSPVVPATIEGLPPTFHKTPAGRTEPMPRPPPTVTMPRPGGGAAAEVAGGPRVKPVLVGAIGVAGALIAIAAFVWPSSTPPSTAENPLGNPDDEHRPSDGEITAGVSGEWSVPAFKVRVDKGQRQTFVEAHETCASAKLELCTEHQWERRCSAGNVVVPESWVAALDSAGLVSRGGRACADRATYTPATETRVASTTCCSRSIAYAGSLDWTGPIVEYEQGLNHRDVARVATALAPTIAPFYTMKSASRDDAIKTWLNWGAKSGAAIHLECRPPADGIDGALECTRLSIERDAVSLWKSEYVVANGLLIGVRDPLVKPTVRLALP